MGSMKYSVGVKDGSHFIDYSGRLKTYNSYIDFVSDIEPIVEKAKIDKKSVTIFFINSYPISSYIFGYLLKMKNVDGVDIRIVVNEVKLFFLFDEIGLVETFRVMVKDR